MTALSRGSTSFDPSSWLAEFSTLGGIYVLDADRRLSLIPAGTAKAAQAGMMLQIDGCPDRREAICAVIERRQSGEIA